MKLLVAVLSCERDCNNGFNQAVRETWGAHVRPKADFFFALGNNHISKLPTAGLCDEIPFCCPDDYRSLPTKVYKLVWWAHSAGYDFLFKCDTDTYVNPRALLSSDFSDYDFTGNFNEPIGVPNVAYDTLWAWASGGSGYWLSRKAMEIVIANPPDNRAICPRLKYGCEDLWMGQILGPEIAAGNILAHHDDRYGRSYRGDYRNEFTSHYCSEGMKRKFNTRWMYRMHEANGGSR